MPPLILLQEQWRNQFPPLPAGTPPPPMPSQNVLEQQWIERQQRKGGRKLNKTKVMIKHGKTRKQKRRAKKQTKKPRKQRKNTRKRNVRK
jgi:hypothetical protein